MSNSLQPHGLYSPIGSSILGDFQAGMLEWVSSSPSKGSSSPKNQTHVFSRSPALQADIWSLSHWGSPTVCFVFFCSVAKLGLTLCDPTDYMGSSGKNTRVGCHFFLQRIFSDQGSNACLLHWQADLYHWATREAQLCVYSHFIVSFSFHFPDQVSLRMFIKRAAKSSSEILSQSSI